MCGQTIKTAKIGSAQDAKFRGLKLQDYTPRTRNKIGVSSKTDNCEKVLVFSMVEGRRLF